MAFIRELPQAESFEVSARSGSFDAEFFVWEAANILEVEAVTYAAAPLSLAGLVRGKIAAREVGPGMWMVKVGYSTLNPQEAIGQDPLPPNIPASGNHLGPEFTFDTVGSTGHINQSRATRSKSTSLGTVGIGLDPIVGLAIDTAKAIGVTDDKVEGTDIYLPKFDWTWTQPLREVPLGYLITLYHLTGKVNYGAPFFGFQPGEVLYLGASGRFTHNDKWSITHRFACSPNQKNIPFPQVSGGAGFTIPFKAGWDYMWFEYQTQKVGTRNLQVPVAGYIEIVYPSGDLGLIFGGPTVVRQRMPGGVWPALKNTSKYVQQIVGTVISPFDGDPDAGAGVPDDGANGEW
jgi:hypothetical protein